jgi:hypothetical protein
LEARGLRLALQVRLIDERHEYHGLSLKPVALAALTRFLATYPNTPVLVSGLLRSEVGQAGSFAPADAGSISPMRSGWTPCARCWFPPDRNSWCLPPTRPFLVTAAATAKLDAARLPSSRRKLIAHRNLDRFLVP